MSEQRGADAFQIAEDTAEGPPRRFQAILPYPPSTNTAYATVNGRRVKTKKAREYATHVGMLARLAGPFPTSPYRVLITVWLPDARRRDLGNTEKLCVDSVFLAHDVDDRLIHDLRIVRGGIDRARPRLVLTIEGMGQGTIGEEEA